MTPLPTLTTTCAAHELDARLAGLSARGEANARERTRATIGAGLFFGSLALGLFGLIALPRPFGHASMGLLALGTLLLLFRVTSGRRGPAWRAILLAGVAGIFALGMVVGLVPTPAEGLAALDVRAFPLQALTAAVLALTGMGGALMWLAASHAPGALEAALVQYAAGLARPLLDDAQIGARSVFRLSPFTPASAHWATRQDGEMKIDTLERTVCEVRVPLEGGEQFVLELTERVTGRTRSRRNARGKLKTKPKGHARVIEARLSWSLAAPSPNSADLTAHLRTHLQGARVRPGAVELAARGEPTSIEVRLRCEQRLPPGEPWSRPDWIEPALVHESARFLAGVRATLAPPGPSHQGATR